MAEAKFIPGLELSERFFHEAVKPILDAKMPDLKYSAGLIGYGSEVLGFDTQVSVDHHWGPRMLMFLAEEGYEKNRNKIDETLRKNLPHNFLGFPTNYSEGDSIGVRHAEPIDSGPVRHFVEFYTIKSYLQKRLGVDSVESLTVNDWLGFSEQRLLETTSGKVFIDGLGTVEKMRKVLDYYPREAWLTKLANEWQKISDLEAFVGRCGEVGDELGSRLVATDIVKSIMQLCFLMEKAYAPYLKWFGSSFKRLASSKELLPILNNTMKAKNWKEREKHLSKVYCKIAEMHNALNVTEKLPEKVQDYFGRKYKVIRADIFVEKIRAQLEQAK